MKSSMRALALIGLLFSLPQMYACTDAKAQATMDACAKIEKQQERKACADKAIAGNAGVVQLPTNVAKDIMGYFHIPI